MMEMRFLDLSSVTDAFRFETRSSPRLYSRNYEFKYTSNYRNGLRLWEMKSMVAVNVRHLHSEMLSTEKITR